MVDVAKYTRGGIYPPISIIETIIKNDAIAATEISITSITEPKNSITTPRAHSIEENDIFFAADIFLYVLFCLKAISNLKFLLFFILSATPYKVSAKTFTAAVSAHKGGAHIARRTACPIRC